MLLFPAVLKISSFLSFGIFIRKVLVRLFDKIDMGTMKEGKNLANRVIEIHKRRYVSFPFLL